jgi:hypothetical protein
LIDVADGEITRVKYVGDDEHATTQEVAALTVEQLFTDIAEVFDTGGTVVANYDSQTGIPRSVTLDPVPQGRRRRGIPLRAPCRELVVGKLRASP